MGDLLLQSSEEVRSARDKGLPIVALESTIISHGLPWPENLETALEAEERVRRVGAVPATIAVIDGHVCIGLSLQQKERLARAENIGKASARDLPFLLAERRSGATTVAGTVLLAHRAGIRIMATGGIGGVHRGVLETGDISADLVELARTPVMVVCSGAKSILDLSRTLELLESLSVPVVAYQTDELPAFFARSSGLRLESRVDTPERAAELIRQAHVLGMQSGLVLANAAPEELAIPYAELEQIVVAALKAAQLAQVHGKAVTPFLLRQMQLRIGTRALAINRAILACNAQLAAEIACALDG
jgi:pseudouridine-5'-phosphate glycosidase